MVIAGHFHLGRGTVVTASVGADPDDVVSIPVKKLLAAPLSGFRLAR
jgi:hypothetical protein